MKALGYVIALLFFFGAGFVGCAGASKALDAAHEIDERMGAMTDAEAKLMNEMAKGVLGEELPSTLRLEVGGLMGLLAVLAGLVLVVMAFVKRKLVPAFAIAAVALAAVVIFIYPVVPTGPHDGMAPRPQQIVATVLAAMSAGGALLARWAADRKAAAVSR